MGFLDLLKFVAALGVVLSLIGGCAFLVNRFNLMSGLGKKTGERRLSVKESLILDAKHRMMIVASDNREHILLFGPSGDLVVESRDTVTVQNGSQATQQESIVQLLQETGA